MAGSISLALSQQFDPFGKPYGGGKVYFIQAGTVATPQNAFQDLGLTSPWPNPYTLLEDGRIPQVYFADGYIKVRIADKNGDQIFNQDNIPVTGPSSGGGGGGGVDPTTVLSTGDMKAVYSTAVISGFVRANGHTIGNSTSGATERANPDTSALFSFLWNVDANLAVSGGRGASASADYGASKTIALPDCRGRALAGLDDMGNSAAGRLTATYFGTAATVLGAAGGSESNSVILTHNHGINDPGHPHEFTAVLNTGSLNTGSGTSINFHPASALADVATTGITIQNAGSAGAHNIASPALLLTIHIKL